MTISIKELEQFSNEFLNEHYGMSLGVEIILNGRLSKSMGRFISSRSKALRIELSKNLVTYNKRDFVLGVLKHELIHYALYEKGLPNNDSDTEFIMACKQLDAPLTGTLELQQPLHHYTCDCHTHKRTRRLRNFDKYGYRCNACGSSLVYAGVMVSR